VPVGLRAVTIPAPVALTVAPDRRRRLSDGVLVEASLLARVMGIRLLTIDATVALVPADVGDIPSSPAHMPPARAAGRSAVVRPGRARVAGHGLAEAVRSINEGAELLAEARRNSL
jgi:hypothetical protein